jgi:hypothetical protein
MEDKTGAHQILQKDEVIATTSLDGAHHDFRMMLHRHGIPPNSVTAKNP